jgi:signal transduction histidine kinase
MTIRLRLTLWYTALLGMTLIFFSVVVYSALAANINAQIVQDSQRQAVEVATAIGNQLERDIANFEERGSIQMPDLNFFASSVGVQLVGLSGVIVSQSSNLERTTIPDFTSALPAISQRLTHRYITSQRGQPLLVYSAPLIVSNDVLGAVQIVRPLGPSRDALNQVSRYLIIGTGLSLIVAAVVGAFLARRELLPIADITRTASSISRAKDLDLRLQIEDTGSEVGELSATFNEMLDRIQSLFIGQERLVADVSHELRTPLTTIQGNMELLQRMATRMGATGPDAEMINQFTEITNEVENETDRMGTLINDLLLLARADSGVLTLRTDRVEMDTLLLDVYRQARRIAEHKKGAGELEVRLGAEDQALVLGDRERLHQLVLNLVDNAIKYTPTGGVITLSLETRDGWVLLNVQDTGIGILPEQQEHIFERFYRTDKARSRELGGSGLGLSIVSYLAQAHGGHVTVESAPGEGSTFTLWLPEYIPGQPSAQEGGGASINVASFAELGVAEPRGNATARTASAQETARQETARND